MTNPTISIEIQSNEEDPSTPEWFIFELSFADSGQSIISAIYLTWNDAIKTATRANELLHQGLDTFTVIELLYPETLEE